MDRTRLPLPRPASNPALRPPSSSSRLAPPTTTANDGGGSRAASTTRAAKPALSRHPSVPLRTTKRDPPSAGNGSGLTTRAVPRPASTTSSAGRRTPVGTVPLATARPTSTVGRTNNNAHTTTAAPVAAAAGQPARRLLPSRSTLGHTRPKPVPPTSTAQAPTPSSPTRARVAQPHRATSGVLGPKRTVSSALSVASLRGRGAGVSGDGVEKEKVASGRILSGLDARVMSPEKAVVGVTKASGSPQKVRAGLMGYDRPGCAPPSPTRIPFPSRVPSTPSQISRPPSSQRTPPPPSTSHPKPAETPLLPRMVSASAAALRASAVGPGGDEQLMDTELSFINEDSGDGEMHGHLGVGGGGGDGEEGEEDDLDFAALGPVKSRFDSGTSFFQTTPTVPTPPPGPGHNCRATTGTIPGYRTLAFRRSPNHPYARPSPTRLPTPTRTPPSPPAPPSTSSSLALPVTLPTLPATTAPAARPSTTPLKRALAQATHQLTTTRALLDAERASHASALARLEKEEHERRLEEEQERRWEEVRNDGERLLKDVRREREWLREMIEGLELGEWEEGEREV
ncbi:hypothetical protein IAT38_008328 [Cryptococcus sp. DSM 104549]